MANLTFLDVVRMNEGDDIVGLVEESLAEHPEIALAPTRVISGTGFNSLVRTALPAAGFRYVNEGVAATKGTYAIRRSSCYLMDSSSECDAALDAQLEGGIDEALAMEASGRMEANMRAVASQWYYGTDGGLANTGTAISTSVASSPTKGFAGLLEMYDVTNMEIDRAGALAGVQSSVWLVRFGAQAVQVLYGNDGQMSIGETTKVRLTDGDGNPYDGYRKPMTFWIGLHCPDPRNAVVRIKNIDTTATLRDQDIYNALQLFPAGLKPDAIFMSRRSLYQLRTNRTATNATGAPAPIPTSVEGIPIYTTDAIVNTEAVDA